ncbi:prefoldin subunit 6 [Mycena pura]|uniref:Prefoldin subunit 6 n=1 Tax=Mycena pura TaxID=153505 RepID=A0AAD6YPL6_9AGAR|nr:prefoldin subunit 6 [Mycena pura]
MSLQVKLQTVSSEYSNLQLELSNIVEARQKLDAQLSENELVDKEFAQLTPDNVVYKQIGPVLVKQEKEDAKKDIKGRLEFIAGEIKRVEAQLHDIQAKLEIKKKELVDIQAALQQASTQEFPSPGVPLPSLGA